MSSLKVGARERLMFEIGKELNNQGDRVHFVFVGASREIKELIEPFPAKTNLLGWTNQAPFLRKINKLKLFLGIWALKDFLKNEKPDVLLAVSIPPSITILIAKILANSKTKIIVRQSNVIKLTNVSKYSEIKRRPRDFLIPFLYREAEAFIAVSEGVKSNLKMLLGNDSNIKVIYNKVLNKKWFVTPSAKPSHPWFNDDSITVFLAVGRLVKKKDYPTMIKAFQIASSQSNNIRLLILGDGPERNKLENLIENAQLKNKIELLGHIQDPHPYYYYSFGYLLSSVSEGMPSSVIEALGSACQIISTDCPSGPNEILSGGEYGKIVEIKDHKKMARYITETLDDAIPKSKLLERAYDFTIENGVKEYVSTITELCRT
ncbi:MAG: glycosyltransferase [Pseudomonadota bacterium]|nr:glycosyltransferase [Pseudomonadota bacterium]